ncbi:hypothetical protein M426DRAFT_11243 [Hypoxylon sp. CI-4A]|nr:hypothetical protein M426DRAFT_11243 [Hypoxylon sp. CI-4A]
MRLAGVVAAATLPVAIAAQQRVLAHSTSMKIEDAPSSSMASMPILVNSTDPLAQAPKPLTTVAPEKPALEASVMGLIVFSAAGLYLL